MIAVEGPREASRACLVDPALEPGEEILRISAVPEDPRSVDAANGDVVDRAREIDP
jgi:hypothetical protein